MMTENGGVHAGISADSHCEYENIRTLVLLAHEGMIGLAFTEIPR